MAYNGYFPAGYQPYMPQTALNTNFSPYGVNYGDGQGNGQRAQNTALNGFLWVQGEAGAKAYPVAPNTTVQLWDSESQTIYLKSADASGMPSMKYIDYTIREQQSGTNALKADLSGYVTREEFEKALRELKNESTVSAVSE